jgi:hypothetical protein
MAQVTSPADSLSYYEITVPQFIHTLEAMYPWLDKATASAETRKFDVNVLMTSRLAPNQLPFGRQIQIATDAAKGIAARLSGQEAPRFDDNEVTIDDIRGRIKKTVDYLKTFNEKSFEGGEARTFTLAFLQNKSLAAKDMTLMMAIPNFYFHVTTAYAILRHNGVELGKMDFLGTLPFKA